jgi:hypothetical protein
MINHLLDAVHVERVEDIAKPLLIQVLPISLFWEILQQIGSCAGIT